MSFHENLEECFQIKNDVEGSYPTFPIQPFSFNIKREDEDGFPGNTMSIGPHESVKLENAEKENGTLMDSKDFDIDSLNGERFPKTSFNIKLDEDTNTENINQQTIQNMDSIKIEDDDNIELFQQGNTRAVIKIEDENDGYEMFSGTNSFHIKVDEDHNIPQHDVISTEDNLAPIDASNEDLNIESEDFKSNDTLNLSETYCFNIKIHEDQSPIEMKECNQINDALSDATPEDSDDEAEFEDDFESDLSTMEDGSSSSDIGSTAEASKSNTNTMINTKRSPKNKKMNKIDELKREVKAVSCVVLIEKCPIPSAFKQNTGCAKKNDAQKFECEECGKCFKTMQHLNRHRMIHKGVKPFKCQVCKKHFRKNYHLKTHMLIHSGIKNFECKVCGKRFSRKDHMDRHFSSLHEMDQDKAFECEKCGKFFASKWELDRHDRVKHLGFRPYKCTKCEKSFTSKSNLEGHESTHIDEEPFECQECGKTFKSQKRLDLHTKTVHEESKPFECKECGKCFSRKDYLSGHQRIHTGEKPYKCQGCGRRFAKKSNLNIHRKLYCD